MKNRILIYYLSQILLFTGASLFNPVSYLFYTDSGLDPAAIGISISILWIVSGIFEIPFGLFTDHHGTKLTMIVSNVLSLCGLGILVVKIDIWTLWICSAIFGVATAANSGCLSSWIVNSLKDDLKDSFNQGIIQKVFSRSNIFCSIVSLFFSFLVLQVIYKYNRYYPIYLSIVAYGVCLLFFIIIFNDESKVSVDKKTNLVETVNSYFKVVNMELLIVSLFFTIPFIMDMGPVNQWSIVYRNTNILGFINTVIVGAFVFGNYFISHADFKQGQILKLVIVDVAVIMLLNITDKINIYLGIIFFIIHVVINTVVLGVNMSYLHSHIIKDDENRNTSISTFNFINSFIVGVLLTIQGIFSNVIGMTNTWMIFSIMGAVIYLMMYRRIYYKRNLSKGQI